MPLRAMNSLAYALLPSNWAPLLSGPMMRMPFSASSCLKKSTMPSTRGCSGPTTTRPISLSRQNLLMPSKSLTLMLTLAPTSAVPALPGAMNTLAPSLWASFQAKACSRPPEPNTRILRWTAVMCWPWVALQSTASLEVSPGYIMMFSIFILFFLYYSKSLLRLCPKRSLEPLHGL